MSEPEIARRCPSCGASIRTLAYFCPQCGKALTQQNPKPETPGTAAVTAPLVDESPGDQSSGNESPDDQSSGNELPGDQSSGDESSGKDASSTFAVAVQSDTEPLESPEPEAQEAATRRLIRPASPPVVGKVRGQIQRATTLARDVEGDMIHRVQQVREISSVVLDEAGEDPSLRFVLVAAVLFVLFLVIVLLNKLIG